MRNPRINCWLRRTRPREQHRAINNPAFSAALRRLLCAAGPGSRETAAEQSGFPTDQCRGGDHCKPGLRRARRRLHLDPRVYDAQQRDQVHRRAARRECLLAQRSQPGPAGSREMVEVGPSPSRPGTDHQRKLVASDQKRNSRRPPHRARLNRIVTETSMRGWVMLAGNGGSRAPRIISSIDASRSG